MPIYNTIWQMTAKHPYANAKVIQAEVK